ncbi:Alpha/beta hydrolase family protein [Pirellula sp. SH-Sr6A]|uniref:CPXCG motif-containing cysteine-rich protein n=1 Tax=Pirellula sp. SH-Sr6A TaxID=1632865 RepID=UPI00078DD070|nr:CPXCG motif-containing cysteine-rich protein [Pirellula sp. SH-Sr6A]AMV31065.1 Alpha/beta hydrolase family protein [Pirellula sp. SH-Sr6A]
MSPKILFLHGWRSVVGGVKPTSLAKAGFEVINPPLDDNNFDLALQTAQTIFDRERPDVIVGSSRGGAIAMNLEYGQTPLVLLCPAWRKWGTVSRLTPKSIVLHSRNDEVIPFEDSVLLVQQSNLPADVLIEVGEDHRLADESSLSVLCWTCRMLCSGESIPVSENDDTRLASSDEVPAGASAAEEGAYLCDACGEEIVIPIDRSAGILQSYVEDCPVCCNPNLIHVQFDDLGRIRVWAEPEQDRD